MTAFPKSGRRADLGIKAIEIDARSDETRERGDQVASHPLISRTGTISMST